MLFRWVVILVFSLITFDAAVLAAGCPLHKVTKFLGLGSKAYSPVFSTNYSYLDWIKIDEERAPHNNLRRLPLSKQFVIDGEFAAQIRLKQRLLRYQRKRIVFSVGSPEDFFAASMEVLEMMTDELPQNFPELYERTNYGIRRRTDGFEIKLSDLQDEPLLLASLLVQEDLTLNRLRPNQGAHELVGGVLCFPSAWSLPTYAGKTMAEVHATSHHDSTKNAQLLKTIEGILGSLKLGELIARNNFFIYDDPNLSVPDYRSSVNRVAPVRNPMQAGDRLFFRSERETMRRLPKSGWILFTIREHVYPLREIGARPRLSTRIVRAIRSDLDELPSATRQEYPEYDIALKYLNLHQ